MFGFLVFCLFIWFCVSMLSSGGSNKTGRVRSVYKSGRTGPWRRK